MLPACGPKNRVTGGCSQRESQARRPGPTQEALSLNGGSSCQPSPFYKGHSSTHATWLTVRTPVQILLSSTYREENGAQRGTGQGSRWQVCGNPPLKSVISEREVVSDLCESGCVGTSLVVQRLGLRASSAGGMALILGRGTKIPYATRGGQK